MELSVGSRLIKCRLVLELYREKRTMPVAHDWIINHFDELRDGAVVDVQFILLETTAPKEAELYA